MHKNKKLKFILKININQQKGHKVRLLKFVKFNNIFKLIIYGFYHLES